MLIVKSTNGNWYSLPSKEVEMNRIKVLGSPLAQSILKLLSEKKMYPAELAKGLHINEQKVYYHIKNLEKAKIIRVVKKETKQGALAKYYALSEDSFFIRFKDFKQVHHLKALTTEHSNFFKPFISDGQLDAFVIVGSPDPHGPEKARSRDGYYGIDFALFLGTFLNSVPYSKVKLDTEMRGEDLKNNNLILIGGPVVNRAVLKFNKTLPIFFDPANNWCITSSISKKKYTSDESGIIIKTKNPLNKEKSLLIIAGKRFSGTKAAIIAFLKGFAEVTKGNSYKPEVIAKVVEGLDLDFDGVVDDVEFRE